MISQIKKIYSSISTEKKISLPIMSIGSEMT